MGLQEIIIIFLIVGLLVLEIVALVDCSLNRPRKERPIWIVIIVVTSFLGAIAYFIYRMMAKPYVPPEEPVGSPKE